MTKRLYKSKTNIKIDGVCAGIAEYLKVDPTIVRILFVLGALAGFFTVFMYIVLMIVLPRASAEMSSEFTEVDENGQEVKNNNQTLIGFVILFLVAAFFLRSGILPMLISLLRFALPLALIIGAIVLIQRK